MVKSRRTSPPRPIAAPGLPTREAILAFIASADNQVGKREIARHFGLSGTDKTALKQLLRSLEDEGAIERDRRHVMLPDRLPPVLVAEIVGRDPDGEYLAEPAEWRGEGSPPRILVLLSARAKPGERPPGIGERALLRVSRNDHEGPAYIGRVVKVLGKDRGRTLGIFRADPKGGGRLVPIDKRARGEELVIRAGDEGEARDGDLVAVRVLQAGAQGLSRATVRERLGSVASERAASLIAIHTHDIPHIFPNAVLAEAEAIVPLDERGAPGRGTPRDGTREDWRDLPLVTIDPHDARDHDDAVHAGADTDPTNPGGFVLTVAIADVAAYVRSGSGLDQEAFRRGNSVYFPDRVVPMLPERLSNDLCSLKPGVERPALAMRIVIDARGRKLRHSVHRIRMRSAAKLAYEQAQAAIDGYPDDTTRPLLAPVLTPLWAAYRALAHAREAREPLSIDLPERKILLKPDGTVDRVVVPERLEAHRLIEEFMILANVCAAETLEAAKSPLLYRVHDEPTFEKMRALGEVLASVGLKLPKGGALRASLFNRILRAVEGGEHKTFVSEIVLRTQAQAEYAAENYGHFGLNLRRYAHFTSPIRRYADLVVHRALITAENLGTDGLSKGASGAGLREIGERISAAERRAMAAERDATDRLIAQHLAQSIGAEFDGRIAGVTRAGLFVKLADTGADGFVPAATIAGDRFVHDEPAHALVGIRTGETYRLGDMVRVRLAEAAPMAGALRFEMVSDGRPGRRPAGRDGRKAARGSRPPFRGRRDRSGTEKSGSRQSGKGKGARKGPRKPR